MEGRAAKILAISLVLIATYYYNLIFSPFFGLTTFLLVLVIAFLFLYYMPSAVKTKIENILEERTRFLLLALIILALIILNNGGLFQEGIIVFQDYSFHFYRTDLLTNVLMPKFQNVIGWAKDFQAGMPEFYDYPPLSYLLTSLLYYLLQTKVSLDFLFRITVAAAFLLPVIGIYRLSKSLFQKSSLAFVASLLWLGFPHIQFLFGNYTTYFALGYTFLGLSFYYDYLTQKKSYQLFSASIFFALTLLSNPMLIVPTFLVAVFGTRRLPIKDFLLLSVCALAIAFIWFVQIYEGSEYLLYIHSKSLAEYPEWFSVYNQFFMRFLYVSPALFFLIFLGLVYKLDKSKERILYAIISLIIFLIVVEYLQHYYDIFTLLQPEKTVMFMRGFFVIMISYFSYQLAKENQLFKSRLSKSVISALVVTAIIGSSLIYIPYQFLGWPDKNSEVLKQFLGYNPSSLSGGIFSFGIKSSTNETFNFIKSIQTEERILFEDSKKGELGSTSIISLGSYFTGKNFIGGPFYHIMLDDQKASAGDGVIFGKNIVQYSPEEFKEKLDAFNIGYVVAWTPEFVNFLMKDPKDFKLVHNSSDEFLRVFQFTGSKNNYAETSNPLSEIKTTEFEDNVMQFEIKNASIGDKINVKSTYNSHWNAFLDNEPINLESGNLHLIEITLPKEGNILLKLVYEKTMLETYAPFISILSFMIVLALAIFTKNHNDKSR